MMMTTSSPLPLASARAALTTLLLLLLLLSALVRAEKDSNVYPWGTNPNTNFKMYWKDAANVLQDLSEFQALYIEVHGCVWSECGVDNFDDDGENHDGDEQWYQTRTDTFCANAAYSLYGIKRHNFKLFNTCGRGTYINSFFTYGGADTLARALDLNINNKDGNRYYSGDDDSYATDNSECVAIDSYGRYLEGGGNNNNNNNGMSTTMGCAAQHGSKYNKFVLAAFQGDYCEGQNYVETLDTLNSYNKAMSKVNCHKIFDLSAYNQQQRNNYNDDDNANNNNNNNNNNNGNRNLRVLEELIANSVVRQEAEDMATMTMEEESDRQLNENQSNDNNNQKRTYNSVAEELLYHSWACDLSLYPNACPDPYGLKRKYADVFLAASKGQPIALAVMNAKLRKPLKILTYMLTAIALYLFCFAYYVKNKSYIQSNGGGWRGLGATMKRDTFAMGVAAKTGMAKARKDMARDGKSRRKKKRRAAGLAGLAGFIGIASASKRSGKKKKRRSKSKSIKRTPSGKAITADDETASQYTEMTDGDYASTKSPTSIRTNKAAEAAFAAAAQFDLEHQQQQQLQSAEDNGTILPPATRKAQRGRGLDPSPTRSSTRARSRGSKSPEPRVFV